MRSFSLKVPEILATRKYEENSHSFRSEFMRDRDRILYSKALRRLSGKTQIFLNSFDDHARTRLTHSLEVAQIGRTIAYQLDLDENLVEAIALGHDLGHTPFGHIGERTLNQIMNGCDSFLKLDTSMDNIHKGFKHNLQSVRVVSELEGTRESGLNLTNFTLFGLKHHSNLRWKKCDQSCLNKNSCLSRQQTFVNFYDQYDHLLMNKIGNSYSWSFEAIVVEISDEIAQRHHDIEDGLIADLVTIEEVLESISKFKPFLTKSEDQNNYLSVEKLINEGVGKKNKHLVITEMSKFIVNFLVGQVITSYKSNIDEFIKKHNINNRKDFIKQYPEIPFEDAKKVLSYSLPLEVIHKEFKEYYKDRILNSYSVQRMDGKGRYIIRRLFKAYVTNPQQLPDKTMSSLYKILFSKERIPLLSSGEVNTGEVRRVINDQSRDDNFKIALLRVICDYISGMTDNYAIKEYKELYG